jgi:hypothetical protein
MAVPGKLMHLDMRRQRTSPQSLPRLPLDAVEPTRRTGRFHPVLPSIRLASLGQE